MKLFYIGILRVSPNSHSSSAAASSGDGEHKALELASSKDLSNFSFFERSSVSQFMSFFADTVAARTAPGQRQSVQEGESMFLNAL